MVVTPRSLAKLSRSMSAQKEKMKRPDRTKQKENAAKAENSEKVIASPAKRNSNPGIRVVNGRIYDSQNGKTCHQCRQKTRDFNAACKNLKNNKPCTLNFCHKCLLNRYGEKAEEVGVLQDWFCPKCRGICNCSFCMKKQGHQPTGLLIHAAKTNGFSSVSEMLQKVGPDNCQVEKSVNKRAAPEVPVIVSPRKRGRENNFDTTSNSNLNTNMFVRRTSPRKHQISNGTNKGSVKSNLGIDQHNRKLPKSKVREEGLTETHDDKEKQEADTKHVQSAESDCREMNFENGTLASTHSEDNSELKWACQYDFNPEIQLPEGFELTSVHDIEISPEDVGKAFQFLEFCAAFGKILRVKKGQPEIVLRDLIHGKSSRRGKHSVVIQFLIQLLSVLQKERGQGSSTLSQNSWMNALRECISEPGRMSTLLDLGSDNGFEYLDSSKKLMIINFLCDEILGTEKFRNWIDEKAKEHKVKTMDAKYKEKTLKQQMQDEIAKAIIQKNGAALSISEHDAIISKIKLEAAAAHAKLMELNGSTLKKENQSSVVRTQPIYLGRDGRAYWRLNCFSTKSSYEILLQDVGTGDTSALDEKWFAFENDQREEIEKHINSLRQKSKGSKDDRIATDPN